MTDAILAFLSNYDYLAVFLLMVAENIFPPIPSEVIVPFIGHMAANGELNFVIAIIIATIGSVVGTSVWFLLGWFVSVPVLNNFFTRYGVYVAVEQKDFALASRFFSKHQVAAVFLGRMVPTVRSVISIPAGSIRMSPHLFIMLTICGTFLWNLFLMLAGFLIFDDHTLVEKYMGPIGDGIIYAFLAIYVFQVVRFVGRRSKEKKNNY